MDFDAQTYGGLSLTGRLLQGRRGIITGAAAPNGIGRATAQLLAAHGARIAILDRDEVGARETGLLVGGDTLAIRCDISDPEQCAAAAAEALDGLGGIDFLINNAAFTSRSSIADVTPEEFDALYRVNLRGMFLLCQAVVPAMRRAGRGNIVCLSSVAGQRGGGLYGGVAYASTKAGVIGLGKAMARELAPDNIRVNIVSPSLIRTDSSPDDSPERRTEFERDVPLGRSGTVWETAGTILFAVSDLSGYVSGATIDVNGGFHLH